MKHYECKRCGHDWFSKLPKGKKPRTCPRCKSYVWEKETEKNGKNQQGYHFPSLRKAINEANKNAQL